MRLWTHSTKGALACASIVSSACRSFFVGTFLAPKSDFYSIRMSDTLKDDMTDVCEKHKINESDLICAR